MPDPNPDKSWEILAFCLCQIPKFLARIARRPGQNPDEIAPAEENFQKIVLAGRKFDDPDKFGPIPHRPVPMPTKSSKSEISIPTNWARIGSGILVNYPGSSYA
jgi:hypothetical protein